MAQKMGIYSQRCTIALFSGSIRTVRRRPHRERQHRVQVSDRGAQALMAVRWQVQSLVQRNGLQWTVMTMCDGGVLRGAQIIVNLGPYMGVSELHQHAPH